MVLSLKKDGIKIEPAFFEWIVFVVPLRLRRL